MVGRDPEPSMGTSQFVPPRSVGPPRSFSELPPEVVAGSIYPLLGSRDLSAIRASSSSARVAMKPEEDATLYAEQLMGAMGVSPRSAQLVEPYILVDRVLAHLLLRCVTNFGRYPEDEDDPFRSNHSEGRHEFTAKGEGFAVFGSGRSEASFWVYSDFERLDPDEAPTFRYKLVGDPSEARGTSDPSLSTSMMHSGHHLRIDPTPIHLGMPSFSHLETASEEEVWSSKALRFRLVAVLWIRVAPNPLGHDEPEFYEDEDVRMLPMSLCRAFTPYSRMQELPWVPGDERCYLLLDRDWKAKMKSRYDAMVEGGFEMLEVPRHKRRDRSLGDAAMLEALENGGSLFLRIASQVLGLRVLYARDQRV